MRKYCVPGAAAGASVAVTAAFIIGVPSAVILSSMIAGGVIGALIMLAIP